MKTEELKTEGYTEQIAKIKTDILHAKINYFFMFILVLFLVGVMLTSLYYATLNEEGYGQIIIILGMIIGVAVIILGYREVKIINTFTHVITRIDSIYAKKQTLEESLRVLKEIYFVMKNLKFITEEFILTREATAMNIKQTEFDLGKEIMELLLGILFDLREDMIESLKQNESALKQAKSEVSTHVNGTNILNQVSEVQVVRLDKQIEQFQELQRVLVGGK